MRRIISMVTIAALLSVSSVPLLPKAAVCHAAEANTDCGTCHTGEHASHTMDAHSMHEPDGQMNHQMHANMPSNMHNGMHDRPAQTQQAQASESELKHKHHKKLTAAEKECRIECGCGCNHSVDGMPHLLAPHVASTHQFEIGVQTARLEPASYPALHSLSLNNPPPPPKTA